MLVKKAVVQTIIHLAAWAGFLLLPLVFYPRPRDRETSFFMEHYFTTFFFVNFAIIVAFYYLNTYVFIPKLLDTRKFIGYTALILVLLIFYAFVPRLYHSIWPSQFGTAFALGPAAGIGGPGAAGYNGAAGTNPANGSPGSAAPSDGIGPSRVAGSPDASGPAAVGGRSAGASGQLGGPPGGRGAIPRPPRPRNPPLLSPWNFAIFLLVFVFSTGIRVFNQWQRSEQRAKEIANEKLQAELSFLKAQINPHFLFNTLNNIYALASNQSEHTAAAVMKLSSIMRYVLTEARNDLVPLEKEILFTSHYIELQKMRLTDKTHIEFSINGDPLGRQIAPLLLLPFVENAFKYGISTRECSPINILLDIREDSLDFSISNHKHFNTMMRMAENTGIGISNTRRRLDLLYPGQYDLAIKDKNNEFSVHLNIPV